MKSTKIIVVIVALMAIFGFSLAAVFGQQGDLVNQALQSKSVPNGVNAQVSTVNSAGNTSQFDQYRNSFNSSVSKVLQKDGLSGKNFTAGSLYSSNFTANGSAYSHLFIPNKHAMAFYKMVNNTVTPLYSSAPAPNGIGDFGIKNVNGTLVGYNYNTSSFEGTVSLNSLNPMYLLNDAPQTVTIQLNTVLNNVTLFGKSDYSFWTQNVIVYSARTHTLSLEDNLWNFSSPAFYLTSNAIYNSTGVVYPYDGVHIAIGPAFTINEPFTVHLYLNSTLLNNRNVVYFNYSIPQISKSGTYDRVTFNSTYGVSKSFKTSQSNFLVSGTEVTPTGYLLYDAELMIGGPGGGSTTDIYGINGSMTLKYLNSTTSAYENVPSAYNFGTDTGETSSGVSIYWNTNDVAYLNAGPSILNGMWGIENDSGYVKVTGSISPSNGFLFINPGNVLNNATAQWSPVPENGKFTYFLSPGNYTGQALASDYQPMYNEISISAKTGGSSISVPSISLIHNDSYGGYTPLFAFSNSQLANITISGNGTASSPYILVPQYVLIDPIFGQINDFGFPVFPGVFLMGTTDYVSTFGEPQAHTIVSQIGLDTMPYFFFSAQNVSIVGNTVSGVLYPSFYGFLAGEVTFWNSSNDMVINSMFSSYVGIAFNSSMDITVGNSEFFSSAAYSAYGNTNFANDLFRSGSFLEDYYSNDSLVGNVFTHGSEIFPYFATVSMRGNVLESSYLVAENSSITESYDQYNFSEVLLFGSILHDKGTSFGYSLQLFWDSTTYVTSLLLNNAEELVYGTISYFNATSMYYNFLESLNSTIHMNTDTSNWSFYELLSSNVMVLSAYEIDPEYLVLMGNITFMSSQEMGIFYESLEANTSVVSSTVSMGPYFTYTRTPFPWFFETYYGSNNFVKDSIMTNNFTMNKAEYTLFSTVELPLNTVTFVGGANTVSGTTFSTINGDQATDLIIQYGSNKVVDNTFTSTNVSLNGNLYGAGSSLIVYGGVNVISGNTFVTINSPAASSFLKYGDVSSGQSQFLYSVTFTENGLPSGTPWTLNFNGTTYTTSNSSYTLLVPSGNYTYTASSPGYVSVSGTVTVVSSSVYVNIPFKAQPRYLVTFNETGLPSSTLWTVILNGQSMSSQTNNVTFDMYNGTFDYSIVQVSGYHSVPVNGTVTVDGSHAYVSISWYTVNYTVTFSSSGLASGVTWGISIDGIMHTSSASTITLSLPNGTYSYSLITVSGYTPSSYTGSFVVKSSSVTQDVVFTANTYTVVFIETGLPSGTAWSVTFNGVLKTTNSTFITFSNVSNGNYNYTVGSQSGYLYTHAGSVSVSNSGASITLSFVKSVTEPSPVIPIVAGIVAGLAAGIVGSVLVLYSTKKH